MTHRRTIPHSLDPRSIAVLAVVSLASCMAGGPDGTEPEDAEELGLDDDEPDAAAPIPTNEREDHEIPPQLPERVDPDDELGEPVVVGYLADAIQRSDAVIYGEIVDIQHRSLHVFDEVDAPYPHTFVTYEVIEGFKGGRPGERVTLRFLGGPNEDGTLVMHGSGIPTFDLGERDIVFIRDNGAGPCPLLSCAAGRLRVVDGLVTSDGGRAVKLGALGEISVGEQLDLDVVEHHDFFGRETAPRAQRLDRGELAGRALELDELSWVLGETTATDDVDLSGLTITPEHPLRARLPRND